MRGLPVQTQIVSILRVQPEPLSAEAVASMLDIETEQAQRELDSLFVSSKVEMRRADVPLYRLPKEPDGETQLFIPDSVFESAAAQSRGWGHSGLIC